MQVEQGARDGSLHCLGNGLMCAYEQGPQIVQVFGPPYSAPSLGQIRLVAPGLESASLHEPDCPVWRHTLKEGGETLGELVDFVDSTLPCLVRRMSLRNSLTMRITLEVPARVAPKLLPNASGALLFEVPAGLYFFHEYPTPLPAFYLLAWTGGIQVERGPGKDELTINCPAGESTLVLAGGAYPQAVEAAEKALNLGSEGLLERTRQHWKAIVQTPGVWQPEVEQAIEDTSLLLLTQQSIEGAVLAGHAYHWAGVRDQYGVARGLLRMGLISQARRILEFYWQLWQRTGRLHNGLGIGVDAFHVHENDRVEITGYLVLQAFDYLAASGDEDFIARIFPLLEWAFQAQAGELVEGMLSFNGDETYVAGGILPRSALNDGSAEATLLFVAAGEKLADWAARHRRWKGERLAKARRILAKTRSRYRANFVQDGRLVTNQPRRAQIAGRTQVTPLPRFRHGVCERCLVEPSRPVAAIWTERSEDGRYLCPDCLAKGDFPAAIPRAYRLNSVSLAPLYLGSDMVGEADIRAAAEEMVALYRQNGHLPCRPDEPNGLAVGYDYGLLLYCLVKLKHPAAQEFQGVVLGLRDAVGAWAEYYRKNEPVGTRCRPWESAVSVEGLISIYRDGQDIQDGEILPHP